MQPAIGLIGLCGLFTGDEVSEKIKKKFFESEKNKFNNFFKKIIYCLVKEEE